MSLYEELIEFGIDYERLKMVMEYKDNWGKLVHSFEYITVLAVVERQWPKELR